MGKRVLVTRNRAADGLDRRSDDDLFVVRNIGNQIDVSSGSVAYGVQQRLAKLWHNLRAALGGHYRRGGANVALSL